MSLLSAGSLLPKVVEVETPPQRNDFADLITEYVITWSGRREETLTHDDAECIELIRSGNFPEQIAGFVAYIGNTPVGCLLIRARPELGATVEIANLFVDQNYRRQGVAQLLLKTAHKYIFNLGCYASSYLLVESSRHEALALYEKFGYVHYLKFPFDGFVELLLPIRSFETPIEDMFRE
jgi:GNAT superfamily N-acetyltransferase